MTALNLTLESDPSVFISLQEHADLPSKGSGFKLSPRTKIQVTEYGGRNAKSVQVIGDSFEPIELEGVWDDRQSGQPGRAKALAASFYALVRRAELIRLEWGDVQLWGFLAFDAQYELSDYVRFKIMFEPLYDRAPAFLRPPPFKTQITTITSGASEQLDQLNTAIEDREGLNIAGAFLAAILSDYLTAAAAVNDLLASLNGVIDYADLGVEIARAAQVSAYRAVKALGILTARVKGATEASAATASATPAAALAVLRWADNVALRALQSQRAAAAALRALVNASTPPANRRHTVREGETLQTIAILYFGDQSAWLDIANANALEAAAVSSGQTILIPDEVSR